MSFSFYTLSTYLILQKNDARTFIPLLTKAKLKGLKLAVHLAEVKEKLDEVEEILKFGIDRIGHGTFLHPDAGGQNLFVDLVKKQKVPIGEIVIILRLKNFKELS